MARKLSSWDSGHHKTMLIKCECPVPAGEGTTGYSGLETMDDVPIPRSTIKDALGGARAGEISTIHRRVAPSVKHGVSQQTDTIADQVDSVIKEARKRFSQAKLERISGCQMVLLTSLADVQANMAISESSRKMRELSQAGNIRDEDENMRMEGFSSDGSTAEDKVQSIQPIHQYSKRIDIRDKHDLQHHEQMQIWLKSLERKRTHLARKIAKREAMTEEMQRGRPDVEEAKIEWS